jgi:FkbM family methyltransferase
MRLLGIEIRKAKSTELQINFGAQYLSKVCNPKVVIDVGVGFGTNQLYEAFPGARMILVEPLVECRPVLEEIGRKYDCEMHYTAVGDRVGSLELLVDARDWQKSSPELRTKLTATGNELKKRVVPLTTLDKLCMGKVTEEGRALLKIDCEGYELMVLHGASELLRVVESVILEVSIARRFEGSYEFEDIIVYMREKGFRVYSFLEFCSCPGDLQQRYADILFKRIR